MSRTLAMADLRTRLPLALPSTPIAWPNEDFTAAEPPAPWLLVELRGGVSTPNELGGAMWVTEGQTFVHVLVPTGTGLDDANQMVDAIRDAFRSPPLDPVVYTRIDDDPGGAGEEDGNYWRTSVIIDWHLQTYLARD